MDIESATDRARSFLGELTATGGAAVALDGRTVLERDWCYVFFWNSVEFLQTGDEMAQLWGNAPIVVPRSGTAPFVVGTHRPVDQLLDEHEAQQRLVPSDQRRHALDRPLEQLMPD